MRNHTYIIVEKSTGNAVMEFFSASIIPHINEARYEVMTAMEYLGGLNQKIKENGGVS